MTTTQQLCAACSKVMSSGCWTNGDGYGDGEHVGLDVGDLKGYCWDCVEAGKHPNHDKEIDHLFREAGMCGFLEAYRGRCRNPMPCEEHASQKCWKCGAPATRNCSVAGSLVCGMPECDEHPHADAHYRGTCP